MSSSSTVFSHCQVLDLHKSVMTPEVPNRPSSADVPEKDMPSTISSVLPVKSTSGRLARLRSVTSPVLLKRRLSRSSTPNCPPRATNATHAKTKTAPAAIAASARLGVAPKMLPCALAETPASSTRSGEASPPSLPAEERVLTIVSKRRFPPVGLASREPPRRARRQWRR